MVKFTRHLSAAIAAAFFAAVIALPARPDVVAKADLQIQGSSFALVDTIVTTQLGTTAFVHTSLGGLQDDQAPVIDGLSAAGELVGPGITTPIPFTTQPGHAFQITGLSEQGTYYLQNVRLTSNGQLLQLAAPSTAAIQVTNALQTSVSVRQLTPDELRARGITVDPSNYDVYEYTFSFLVDGKTVSIPYPVIINKTTHEIQPLANEDPYNLPADTAQLPPRWAPPSGGSIIITPDFLDFSTPPTNGDDDPRNGRPKPQIHCAIVIPNSLAVLHQFFAVGLIVANGAPAGSNVTLDSIGATIDVPNQLRVASVAPPTAFGQPVTITDPNTGASFLIAQGSGKAEWTLEGLKPGTYTVNLDVKATFKSPGQPDVPLESRPQATVVVHDARFNITFSHPDTIRKNLQYSTYTYITNISDAAQTITLSDQGLPACSSGGYLANVCRVDTSPSSYSLTIQPGETKSVQYKLQSSLTGHIYATAASIDGDSSVINSAQFQLVMGVSPTGVPLSPATLILPYYAKTPYFSQNLLDAELGYLGVAYSLATSPLNSQTAKFPRLITTDVFTRAVDLARAGERIFIGEDPRASLPNFVLDSLGNAAALSEWDQFLRQEVVDPAGDTARSLESAIGAELSTAFSQADGTFNDMADRFAGSTTDRGPYLFALAHGAKGSSFDVKVTAGTTQVLDVDPSQSSGWRRGIPYGGLFPLSGNAESGTLAVIGRSSGALDLTITSAGGGTLDLIFPAADGSTLTRASASFTANAGQAIHVHIANGVATSSDVTFSAHTVPLAPISIVAARQDTYLDQDGHVVSVLFNRRLPANANDMAGDFNTDITLDQSKYGVSFTGKRTIAGAALQADGRIIRLNYDNALSSDAQYLIHTSNLVDPSSNATVVPVVDVRNSALLYGTVFNGDNTIIPGAQLQISTGTGLQYQLSDAAGHFLFEYIPRDPDNNLNGDYELIAAANGRQAKIDGTVRLLHTLTQISVVFVGRGSAQGTVRYTDGTPVPNANVVVGSTLFSQFRTATTKADGTYSITDLPVGPLTFSAQDTAGNTAYAANELRAGGQLVTQDISIYRQPFPGLGTVYGRVIRNDTSAPVAGARVGVYSQGYGFSELLTDATGTFSFSKVPAGFVTVLAADFNLSPTQVAVDFDLKAGESHNMGDFQLVIPQPGTVMVSVDGDVTAEDPLNPGVFKPVPNAQVQIHNMPVVVADAQGHYHYDSVPQTASGSDIFAYDASSGRGAKLSLPDLQPPSQTTPTNIVPIKITNSSGSGKGTIRVHLLSASGQPVDGYHVFWSNSASMFDAVSTGAGVYEFQNLAVGTSIEVIATPQNGPDPSYGSQTAKGSGSVQFAGQIAAITLRLGGQGTVTANVQQATQAGVYVKIAAKLALTYMVWSDAEQDMVPHTSYATTDGTTDAVFLRVPVGSARLETVDSAGYASTDVPVGYDGAVVSRTLTLSTLAEVRGHVFAPDGYTPVAGANVRLFDGAQDLGIAITGVDGSFDYKNLVPSSRFTATADYTVNGIYRTGIASGSTPATGGIVDNVTIILEQQGSVQGTVVDSNNNPVPFAKIWLRELSYPSRNLGTAADPRFTDGSGHFRFNNIFAVGVRVSAEDPNNPDSRGDWSGVVQKENDVQTANITLSSTGLGSVRITVLDPNNALAPVPNTEISLYRNGGLFDFGTTDATGSIQFDSLPVDGSNSYTAGAFSQTQFKSGVSGAFAINKNAVTNISITLTFSGEVSGTLTDPQNSNAPVPGSNVTLVGTFLKLGYQTRATTGTDGSYDFKGVREGSFTLAARDPNSIRMARGQGIVSSVYPTATVPLTLEPTSTLTVKAFLPNDAGGSSGILAPLVNIDVTQNSEGGKYLRSSQTNGAQFPGLVRTDGSGNPIGVSVTITELGGLGRVIRAGASFDANTAAKELDVVFSASGSVIVTVQKDNPPVPAANVQVSAGSGGVSRSGYTDANGFVSLSGLPLGTVGIQAVLTGTSPLSGSTSVQLNSQSTPATASILLGSYDGVTGKVFAEASTSPSVGTRVLANFGSVQLETRTDATGTYTFRGIAVPPPPAGLNVNLTYVGPDDNTIGAQQTVALQSGQGIVLAQDVTLDSTPPRLVSIFPADGAQKVAPDTQLKFTFSRAIRNDQFTSGGNGYFHIFEGSSGTELVLSFASAVVQPDGSEVVTFNPPPKPPAQTFPLKSNTLYRLLISGKLQDLANHFLGPDLGASFTTSDYSAPQVVKVDPSPKLPLPKNGIRIGVTFSKPLSPTPWQTGGSGSMTFTQITAIGGQPVGSPITGNVQLDPITGATLFYAPDVALTPAAFYRISLSGVVDTDGRAMVDANGVTLPVYTQDFFTYDTVAPAVTINNPTINGTAIGDSDSLYLNVLYSIGVTLKNPDGSAVTDLDHVDFYSVDANGNITPITRTSPTTVSIAVPAGTTSFTLRADAWDLSLNKGTASRTWTVSSQPALTINSTTITPATVFPGGSVTDTVKIGGGGLDANVVVTATQDGNPTPLGTASTSISRKLFTDPWPDAALALTIPLSVAGGSHVNLIATVSDIRGNSATPKTDVLTLATDSNAPVSQPVTIQIVKSTVPGSPSNTFNNGDKYIVHGYASDAETGVASMTFVIGTATYTVTAGQTGSTFHSNTGTWEFVSPTITVQSHNNDYTVAISAKASDYAGNYSSAPASVTYLGIHDPNAPNVAWIAPLHDAAWPAATTITARLRVFATSPLPLAGTFDVPGAGTVAATRNGNELDATLTNFTTPAAGTVFQIVAHVNDGDGGHVIDLPINVDIVTTGQTIPSGGTIAVDATHPLNSDSIVVDGGRLVIYIPLTLKNLIVINGGLVDTVPGTTSADHKIDLTITDHLYVDDASSIDTSRRGYLGGLQANADNSGSNSSANGMTLGRTATGGATNGASGSFGGVGGDDAGTTNATYGSISAPADLGSGGAADSSNRRGGQGGGSAFIHTDGTGLGNVVIAGALLADGESGVNIGGAGSGGSIHVSATQIVLGALSKVSASGGDDDGSTSATRAAGGGRISLEATKLIDIDATNGTRVFALGGRNNAGESGSALDGGAGTIFFRNPGETHGELVISALDPRYPSTAHLTRSTPLTGTLNFDQLTLGPRALARADASLTINGTTDDKTKATVDPSALLLLQNDVPALTISTNPAASSSIIQGTSIGLTYTATSPAGVGSVTYAVAPAVAAHSDTFPYTVAPAQQTPTIVVPGSAPTGSATLTVHLVDRAGRTADASPVPFTIIANQAPLITDFTVNAPSPLYIGNSISTSISASDDVAVKTISLTSQLGTNSPSTQSATPNATPATQAFTVAIPKDATLDGKTVTLTATAADGVAAPVTQVKTLTIAHDGNPPSVAISQPNAGTPPYTVDSGVLIHVVATAADAESGVNPTTVIASIPGSASKTMTPTGNPNEYAADLAIPFEPGTQNVTVNVTVTASDYLGNARSATAPVQITPHYDPSAPVVTWNCGASGALVPPGVPVTLSVNAVPGANNVSVQSVTFNDGTNNYTATKNGNVYSYNYTIPAGTPDGTVITILASALTSGQGTGTAQAQITATAVDKTISTNTTINSGDLSYDFQNVAITGGTTTIIGHHEFKKLIVINGATLTETPSNSSTINSVDIKATAVYVACGAAIDASGKGYPTGSYPGAAPAVGGTSGAGSHIGVGGSGSTAGAVYGSVEQPQEPGGAGGGYNNQYGAGGGVIKLVTTGLSADGAIRANGASNSTNGAGGSVWITTSTLDGTGTIEAKGVCCGFPASGGGAVSVSYTTLNGGATVLNNVTAAGGGGNGTGGAGSIFVKGPSSTYGSLTIDYKGAGGGTTQLPAVGNGTAQASGNPAVLVTDYSAASAIPQYFVGHWIEVIDGSTGSVKGLWRIATINGKSVTLTPNGSETISIAAGDQWRGVYRFDNITVNGVTLISQDRLDGTIAKQNGATISGNNLSSPAIDLSKISLTSGALGPAIVGKTGSITDPDTPITVFAFNQNSGLTINATVTSDGSFSLGLSGAAGDPIYVYARDANLYPLQTVKKLVGTLPSASSSAPVATTFTSSMTGNDGNFHVVRFGADNAWLVTGNTAANKLAIFDITTGSPVWKQTAALNSSIFDAQVRNGVAYISDGNYRLGAVDLTATPATEGLASTDCGNAYAVALYPTYAFVSDNCTDGRLNIFDLSNPKAPVRLRSQSTLPTNTTYTQLINDGRYLIGITPNIGGGVGHDVVVLDVQDINSLVKRADIDIPSFSANRGALVGSMLYLSSNEGSLGIVDLSTPTAPVIKSVTPLPAPSHGIAAVNNLVFVADDTNGVVAFDVTDPTAPKALGNVATAPQAAWDVVIRGQVGYIAAFDRILTFPVGTAPQVDATKVSMSFDGQKATLTGAAGAVLGSAPLTVAVHDETNSNVANVTGVAVGADGSFTAQITTFAGDVLDVTATDSASRNSVAVVIGAVPFSAGSATTSLSGSTMGDGNFRARRIGLDGTWMAVTTYPSGFDSSRMAILDMTGGTPALKQSFGLYSNARDTVVKNGIAYVPDANYTLEAIDLTAAPNATENRASLDCSSGWSVLVDGGYAFVGDGCGDGRIDIFDLTNPKAPIKLRSQSFGGSNYAYTQLIAYGNYFIGVSPNLVNGTSHDVSIFDRRDINNLARVGDLDIPNFVGFRAVLAGSLLYIVSAEGHMAIVDVSNVAAPVLKSVTATNGIATGITVAGTQAAVADGVPGVTYFDVSNPAAPKLLSTQSVGGSAWDVKQWGGKLYVANESGIVTLNGLVAPPVVNTGLVWIARTSSGATVTGATGAIGGTAPVTLTIHDETNSGVANVTGVAVAADGSFTAAIAASSGDVLDVTATDGAGRSSTATVIGPVPFGSATSILSLTPAVSGDNQFRARRLGLDGNWMAAVTYPGDGNFDSSKMAIMDMSSGSPVLKQLFGLYSNARDVSIRNGIAYVPDANYNLEAIDLTAAPNATENRASLDCSSGWSVLVDGTYAYVGDGCGDGRLSIFDLTNPKVPVKLRSQSFGGSNYAYTQLIAYGNYIIGVSPNVVNGTSHDVSIWDRRNINNLVRVADLDIPNFAGFHATLAGTLLYIGSVSPSGQMAIVDVSNPSAPVVKSVTATQGFAWDVIVSGKTAIVADSVGVTFFDVSNPSAPKYLGTQVVGGNVWDVREWGGKLYVANEQGIVTIPNLVAPPVVNTSQISLARAANGATVTGVAGAIGGNAPLTVTIHDETNSNVANVTGLAVNADGSFSATIGAASGDVLDVTAFDGGGRSSATVVIGSVPFGSSAAELALPATLTGDSRFRARGLGLDGTWLATVTYNDAVVDSAKMVIADMSTGTPVYKQAFGLYSGSRAIMVRNGVAYVPDGNYNLEAIDLTAAPNATETRASLDCSNGYSVLVDGTYAYVGDGCGDGRISIFDITNPKVPVKLRSQSWSGNGWYAFTQLMAYGNYIVGVSPNVNGGTNHDVSVFDRRDIDNLVRVADVDLPNFAGSEATIAGSMLYIVSGDGHLAIVDLTDPTHPALKSVTTTQGAAYDVVVAGNQAIIGDGTTGVSFYDVSNPAAPKLIGTQTVGAQSWDLKLWRGNLYVSNEMGVSTVSSVLAPPIVNKELITVVQTTTGARVTGTAGAIGGTLPLTLVIHDESNSSTADTTGVAVNADGSFTATIGASAGDVLDLKVTDGNAFTSTKTVIASVPLGSSVTTINTIPLANDSNYRTRRIASDGTYVGAIMYPIGWDSSRLLSFSLATGTPVFSQNVPLQSGARAIAVRNGTAYVSDANYGFEAVDLTTNPATIKKASLDCSNGWSVGVDGNYAFVGDNCNDGRIDIFDISNAKTPVKVRSQSTESSGISYSNLIPYGNYLVGITPNTTSNNVGHDVVVFDKSNINSLVKVADIDIPNINLFEGRIYGHMLYASGDTGVVLVDLTTPSAPSVLAKVVTPGAPRGLDLDPATNRLYVADGTAGETAIDVSIPTAPKIIGSQAIGGNGWGTQLVGTNLIIGSEDQLTTISLVAATGTSSPTVMSTPATTTSFKAPELPPPPVTETKLHAERGLISVTFANGTATVRGAMKAVVGNEPLTVSITNATVGTSVPVIAVAADGGFEATISAAPGDHLTLRATSGSGEAVDVDLGEIPGAAPQGALRHLPVTHGLDVPSAAIRDDMQQLFG